MTDVVFIFGRFKASLWAGLAFSLMAMIAGVLLAMLLGGIGGPAFGMFYPLACAVLLAFPIGAVIGHPILHGEKPLLLKWVVFRGVAVPFIASSLAIISLYVFMFATQLVFAPQNFDADPYFLLMPLYLFFSGPLFVQATTGWLTYPCGFCAAYALQKLRLASGIPKTRTMVLLRPRAAKDRTEAVSNA